jgi:hypothetical protein
MSSPKSPQTQILGERLGIGKLMRGLFAAQEAIAHMEPQGPRVQRSSEPAVARGMREAPPACLTGVKSPARHG